MEGGRRRRKKWRDIVIWNKRECTEGCYIIVERNG